MKKETIEKRSIASIHNLILLCGMIFGVLLGLCVDQVSFLGLIGIGAAEGIYRLSKKK